MSNAMLSVSRIEQHYHNLSKAEKKIADVILQDPKQMSDLSAAQIAEKAGVSPATVVRFCRSIGFRGIAEFKMYLDKEQLIPGAGWGVVRPEDSIAVIAQKDFAFIKAAIDDTLMVMDYDTIDRAVQVLYEASVVAIYAEGGSSTSARCAYDEFLQIGIPCFFEQDPFCQVLSAHRLTASDVALTVCHSGAARNAMDAMQVAKEAGALTIAIVGMATSPMAKLVDIPIYTGLATHLFFSDTIAARVCELSVISTLQAALTIRKREKLGNYRHKISELLRRKRIAK